MLLRVNSINPLQEKLSYVALDFDKEIDDAKMDPTISKPYELPGGTVINVIEQRFRYDNNCPFISIISINFSQNSEVRSRNQVCSFSQVIR